MMIIVGCLGCHKPLDGHLAVDGGNWTPQPGDVLICTYCSTYNVLDQDLRPREPNDQERESIKADVQAALDRIRREEQS